MSNYTPKHSRSKSYAYGGQGLPPPPTDAEITPVDYHVPASNLYRRHSRKKSSQILVEPIGAPKTNYMPISPTITVPPALQTIFDDNDRRRLAEEASAQGAAGRYSPENASWDQENYTTDGQNLKRHVSSTSSSNTGLSPASGFTHRRSNTISHRTRTSVLLGRELDNNSPPVPFVPSEDLTQNAVQSSSNSDNGQEEDATRDHKKLTPPSSRVSSGASFEKKARSVSQASNRSTSRSPEPPAKVSHAYSANTLASGASFLIAGQFFSKLVTFFLNQLILRFVGPETFGINAQLELLITTILFFSREAVRLATQRQTLSGKQPDLYRFEGGVVENTVSGTIQQVINFGFVPSVVGIPLAFLVSYAYIYFSGSGPDVDTKSVNLAVVIFACSSIVELISEPSFLLYQLQLKLGKRASFESAAIFARCIITVGLVILGRHQNIAIIAFAVGQFAYSAVLAMLYVFNAMRDSRIEPFRLTWPQGVWGEGDSSTKVYFSKETTTLAASIWIQTVFKHCLTEGDKFLISLLLPYTAQGVYAVVVNYGSLIARLVFLPIEEALRNFLSKLLAPPPSQENIKLSVNVISTLLRVYIYLSVFALAFGPMVSAYVLQFLISSSWMDTDAPIVLATYACYIPFLAINGALESFVQSVATPADIGRQATVLFGFSISFAVAAYVFMRPLGLGAQGLVLANMFNMAQRIGWCIMWIEEYYSRIRVPNYEKASTPVYHDKPWGWLALTVPRALVFGVIAGLAPTVWIVGQAKTFSGLLQHVFLACVLLAAVIFSEKDNILELVAKYRNKNKVTEEEKKK